MPIDHALIHTRSWRTVRRIERGRISCQQFPCPMSRTLFCGTGSSLEVMERDSVIMRGPGPVVFAQVKHGGGVPEIVSHVENALAQTRSGV